MQTNFQNQAQAASTSFFRIATFCTILFFCHRLTSFGIFARGFPDMGPLHLVQSFFTGVGSDLWVATLLGILGALPVFLFKPRFMKWLTIVALIALSILVAAHQGYIEFYRTPIMAFHLRYLLDPEFLGASATTTWSPLIAINVLAAVLAAYLSAKAITKPNHRAIPLLILGAAAIHGLQIRYRVQWFVPGPMQFNPIEKITYDLQHTTLIPPPTRAEGARFSVMREAALKAALETTSARNRLRGRLRTSFQQLISNGKRPVIAVMALETFRPTEIGAYRTGPAPTTISDADLTPNFDRLSRIGLLFREAWSSGTVTCAGQEALWCGYPSGLFTSLMRFRTESKASCIPEEIRATGGDPIWIHNGQGKFDNQVSFWLRHGVSKTISAADYPAGTPGSSWGLSDLALAERAISEIAMARTPRQPAPGRHDDKSFIAPFILTVSNHIPWDLPSDASREIQTLTAPEHQNQKMWRTTAYTDQAIGKFVAESKTHGIWEDMILILVSDHGNLEPGKHNTGVGGEMTDSATRRQSHIALLLTGGIVESNMENLTAIDEPVGQTGVAELIRWITSQTDLDVRQETPDILSWPPNWPVSSDQNESLFIPTLNVSIDKSELSVDLGADPIGEPIVNTSIRDAGIVYKVLLDAPTQKPIGHANQAPFKNRPSSRSAD